MCNLRYKTNSVGDILVLNFFLRPIPSFLVTTRGFATDYVNFVVNVSNVIEEIWGRAKCIVHY